MNKDIDNYNADGKEHGYQEWYTKDNKLFVRTKYKNGFEIGYEEIHGGKIEEDCFTTFYIR
jgi:hypothetical protein